MTKLKAPLLSLGAAGPLGPHLSFRRRGGLTIAERTPVLKDAHTLKQIYQRWLYQDYASYWQQQTPATKLIWETNARPFHMTGFAYWMKTMLSTLPDIAGGWRLDEASGPSVADWSKNGNTGTIFQATPTPGVIDGAYLFDGINDYIGCGTDTSLLLDTFTVEAFINTVKDAANALFWWSGAGGTAPPVAGPWANDCLILYLGVGLYRYFGPATFHDGLPHHIAIGTTSNSIVNSFAYLDGVQLPTWIQDASGVPSVKTAFNIAGGTVPSAWFYNGWADHVILYNRILSPTDILRHALRRYP